MEVSLRSRLGGRRAISWQAVIIGDLLIVVLATVLAAAQAGDARALDAATDVFAITVATALVAAAYTGLAHLTIFRNRGQSPLPVPIVVGFHLSIGVIFLIGFAVGAAILGSVYLGGTATFSVAVLIGGLLVCIPTSLLLDHSDRYRTERNALLFQLAELEQLRISEWALRQALRALCDKVDDPRLVDDLTDRFDTLDLSDATELSVAGLWDVSSEHHGVDHPSPREDDSRTPSRSDPAQFSTLLFDRIARDFPDVRWSHQVGGLLSVRPRFPLFAGILTVMTVTIFLTAFLPTWIAALIAASTALGVVFVSLRRSKQQVDSRASALGSLGLVIVWAVASAALWLVVLQDLSATTLAWLCGLTAVAALVSTALVSWVTAVVNNRADQLRRLADIVEHRRQESAAIFSSLTAIVGRMSDSPHLRDSAAIAACSTGLTRAQRTSDPVHARRIIDWTESIVSAPGLLPPVSLPGRLDEVVHPWRALAEITVDCDALSVEPHLIDDIVAIVDEAVRNACRHGEAQDIRVTVDREPQGLVRIEVIDDGVGVQPGSHGLGFERFAALGTGGYDVSPRTPEPGTRVVVLLDDAAVGA